MKLRHFATPVLLACLSPMALSATQGSLGADSTGTSTVSIDIQDNVQVSVEGDVTFTYSQGTASYTQSTGICIYHRNVATAGLTLSTGNTDGSSPNAFNMRVGAAGTYLPYAVAISGADTFGTINNGGKVTATAHTTSTSCDNGGGATFPHDVDITVSGANADAVPAGSYTDTLTIFVEPT